MKTLKYLSIVLTGLVFFIACQKELSLDSGFAGKTATGSLLDSANNCRNIAVSGPFIVDSTLNDNSYVSVQVNFATGGAYRIFTDTQNGFSFQDSGYAPAGTQTIKLKATGRPVAARATTFTVAFDTTFCSFTVTVISKTPATYSLAGTPGSCTTAGVQGTYTTGIALNSANKVSLQVNVTALGSYSVSTISTGGMSFSGTGTFTTLGPQTIVLQGSGTPTTAGANSIPVTAGSSTCSFTVNVTAGTTGNVIPENDRDSAWSFNGGTNFFHGPFYDVFDTTINNIYGFIFLGYTPTTGDTTIQFGVFSQTGKIASGSTYNSANSLAAFYYTDYKDTSKVNKIYTADFNTPSASTTITISAYDSTTRIVTGTFGGSAVNATGTVAPITNGKFRAKVRKT
ncbi:hypothetical protein [Segetibacter aerophilus]|uniref:Uncharacterized protein n=1 Tax=Segetibacter aerophilus TaxID=670293 RepID=A0A512BB32_9BACT|nr:hypothetical protein [Segetibacter aerophilus]GEO09095.1 hypothetical protein SAE01_15910 [Segetibacter aerophilus]